VRHAAAVVTHFDQLPPPALEDDVDRRGPGVDRVLDQLLDDRRRALDDFAGRNLIDEVGREALDRCPSRNLLINFEFENLNEEFRLCLYLKFEIRNS